MRKLKVEGCRRSAAGGFRTKGPMNVLGDIEAPDAAISDTDARNVGKILGVHRFASNYDGRAESLGR